jgi:hypothetical protein
LIVSQEIASKQRYRDRLRSGNNVLVVGDPRNRMELAEALSVAVTDLALARSIGDEALILSRSLERHDEYISGWEGLIERIMHRATAHTASAANEADETRHATDFVWLMPDLFAFLRKRVRPLVDGFARPPSSANPFETAIAFCDYMMERVGRQEFGEELPKLQAVLAYARARLAAGYDAAQRGEASFAVSDRLIGARVTPASAAHLVPISGEQVVVSRFDYDVAELAVLSSLGGLQPTGDDEIDFAEIAPCPTLMLFSRSPNLILRVLRIDQATRNLLERCDGSVTTAGLIDDMCRFFAVDTAPARQELTGRVYVALDHLYRSGVLVFGEHADGWGWAGGERSRSLAGRSPVQAESPDKGQFAAG